MRQDVAPQVTLHSSKRIPARPNLSSSATGTDRTGIRTAGVLRQAKEGTGGDGEKSLQKQSHIKNNDNRSEAGGGEV